MSTTTDRLRKQAMEVSDDLQEIGSTVKDAAQEKFEQLRSDASECCAEERGKVSDRVASFEQYVGKRPLRSLLIAAGVGLLLGRFWKRR